MKIHFIGIGGIGVSALAKYYLENGNEITGSDLSDSEITDCFVKKGIKVFIGKHKAENVAEDTDMIIYSPAVSLNNPERKIALKLKMKVRSYPEALGELTNKHFTIAVAGSHGKSTTVAMLGLLLIKAGLDPTVMVGTKLKEFGNSNCRIGKSKYLIIEACEHFSSFLNYWPSLIVLLSVEADHLDFHKDMEGLLKSFNQFIDHLPDKGVLVVKEDDKNIEKLRIKKGIKIVKFSLKQKEAVTMKKALTVPGDFNVSNALAALSVARVLKVPDKISFNSLSKYKSSWRRFDVINVKKPFPFVLVDDYGHHPTQVEVTLKAAREKFGNKKIWCVYQPHQYQRTHYLFDEFVKAFKTSSDYANRIIITDIYSVAGREKQSIKKKVSSKKLVKAIGKENVIFVANKDLERFLRKGIVKNQVLIIMGAGDIYNLSLKLRKHG